MPINLVSESGIQERQAGERDTGTNLRRPGALMESALDRALDCVARVAGEVGHELNNQLAVILNYSYVLGRRCSHDPALQEHVDELRQAAWNASDLANQLHHFGSARRLSGSCTDLGALLQELEPVLLHGLDPDRELDLRADEDLFPVAIPRGPLESMLLRAALIKHRSVDPLGPLRIHAYNAERRVPQPDGGSVARPYVQLQVGRLPLAFSRHAVHGEAATAGGQVPEHLLSDRVRSGLQEMGALLDIEPFGDRMTATLWMPAAV